MATPELRPLGIGELLDRAVTLAVRNARALLLSIAVVYVPYYVLQWLLTGGELATHGTRTLHGPSRSALGLISVIGALTFAYQRGVSALVVAGPYTGTPVSLRTAFSVAARRFGAQILAGIAIVVVIVATIVGLTAVLLVLTLILTGGVGTISALVLDGIAAAVAVPLLIWLGFSYELATIRIAVGSSGAFAVVFATIAATFRTRWRSLLGGTVTFVLLVSDLVVMEMGMLVPETAGRAVVSYALMCAASIAAEAISVAFLVVWNVDLAVRHEGLDIAAALDVPGTT